MLVINTPGNPTGVVQSYETLKGLADLAIRHDLIVVSDEIYEKLVYGGEKHISIASLPGMKERTITLNGFSKCYSMTGWRLGYAAAPVEFIKAMVRVHQYINTCAASFVQEAGITALEKAEPDVQEMVKGVRPPQRLYGLRHQQHGRRELQDPRRSLLCLYEHQVLRDVLRRYGQLPAGGGQDRHCARLRLRLPRARAISASPTRAAMSAS